MSEHGDFLLRLARCGVQPSDLKIVTGLYEALSAAKGYLLNAKIDLETGCTKATAIQTIEGGLKRIEPALVKAVGGEVCEYCHGTGILEPPYRGDTPTCPDCLGTGTLE